MEQMKRKVSAMLEGINRYNPENLSTLEQYLDLQIKENSYDLEANLTILKLYQFNPDYYRSEVACRILMKALTNLPYPDFVLCKCLLTADQMEALNVKTILYLGDLMEMCKFAEVWKVLYDSPTGYEKINGFEDAVRRYICRTVGITFQTMSRDDLKSMMGRLPDPSLDAIISKYGWKDEDPSDPSGMILVGSQEQIKTRNITEKIDFESVSTIMATCKQ